MARGGSGVGEVRGGVRVFQTSETQQGRRPVVGSTIVPTGA